MFCFSSLYCINLLPPFTSGRLISEWATLARGSPRFLAQPVQTWPLKWMPVCYLTKAFVRSCIPPPAARAAHGRQTLYLQHFYLGPEKRFLKRYSTFYGPVIGQGSVRNVSGVSETLVGCWWFVLAWSQVQLQYAFSGLTGKKYLEENVSDSKLSSKFLFLTLKVERNLAEVLMRCLLAKLLNFGFSY